MPELRLNQRAARVADDLALRADALGAVVSLVGKARVIDAGVRVAGSVEAGLLVARACMADLGSARVMPGTLVGMPLPCIAVDIAQPVAACMASQYAGWRISVGTYFAMGSGPMRAAYGKEDLFGAIGLRETARTAVGVLETSRVPDAAVIAYIAGKCGVEPSNLTLIAARTASLAGGTQVAARSVETALHKLHELGFDLGRIVGGLGWAPLPPVAGDDLAAIGRTNDAVLYGARVVLHLTGDDASLIEVGAKLPASASPDHGEPFARIFKRAGHDFYKIDPLLFSPAQVSLQNLQTGRTFTFGNIDEKVLAESFFGSGSD